MTGRFYAMIWIPILLCLAGYFFHVSITVAYVLAISAIVVLGFCYPDSSKTPR